MAKKPSKKTLRNKLDKLVGEHCRSKGFCEAKGKHGKCSDQLQWCHIKSRRYLSTRWSLSNCVCMCASHHRYFTDNPDDFTYFLQDRFPHRLDKLHEEFAPVKPMRVNDMIELYDRLKEELK